MLRRDIGYHKVSSSKTYPAEARCASYSPYRQGDFYLFAYGEIVGAAIVHIEFGFLCFVHGDVGGAIFKAVDCINGAVDESLDTVRVNWKE